MQRILVVAAHPDDEILGCGATMRKLTTQGKQIRVAFVAEGSTCRFEKAEVGSAAASRAIEERSRCAREALELLGVRDYTFYDLPCGRLCAIPIIDIVKLVEREILHFQPDTIFTHSEHDCHNDHRVVFQAALQATRPGVRNFVKTVLSFEVISSTEWRFTETFQPNFFVCVQDQIAIKKEAMAKYVTEQRAFPFPRSPEGLDALARVRGMQVGCSHAEAFSVIRSIEA